MNYHTYSQTYSSDNPFYAPNANLQNFTVPVDIFHMVNEVTQLTKAPQEMVLASALGAMSLVCQGRINCKDATGSISPCGLFFLTIAESGERKSTVDRIFSSPIKDFENHQLQLYQKQYKEYKSKHDAWLSARKGIISQIKGMNTLSEEYLVVEKILISHDENEPIAPKRLKLLYTDATPEAIVYGLYTQGHSAGLMSDEAGGILNGRAMADLALLNQIWDGSPLSVERKNSESFSFIDARLTISLMTQENSLRKFLSKKESLARDIGFLARCFVVQPNSTQGNRLIKLEEVQSAPTPYLDKFKMRLSEIINMIAGDDDIFCEFSENEGIPNRKSSQVQVMSSGARAVWVNFFNSIEIRQANACFFSEVRDAASKSGLNAIRLASIYQYFEDGSSEISEQNMVCATGYCMLQLMRFKALFGYFGKFSPDYQSSDKLANWMRLQFNQKPSSREGMRRNDIRQNGPIRNSSDLARVLAQWHAEKSIYFENRDGTEWVIPIGLSPRFPEFLPPINAVAF